MSIKTLLSVIVVAGLFACSGPSKSSTAPRAVTEDSISPEARAKFLSMQCAQGDYIACQQRGFLTANGKLEVNDLNTKREYLDVACLNQEPTSCRALGDMFKNGEGVEASSERAYRAYVRACDHGDGEMCVMLAKKYEAGAESAGSSDLARAATFLQRACEQGAATACLELGRLKQVGNGIDRDRAEATRLFERSCSAGEPTGCTKAADMYRQGWGVAYSPAQAASLYNRACNDDDPKSCRELSQLYRNGEGVRKNDSEADRLLERACNMGSPSACTELRALREVRNLPVQALPAQ